MRLKNTLVSLLTPLLLASPAIALQPQNPGDLPLPPPPPEYVEKKEYRPVTFPFNKESQKRDKKLLESEYKRKQSVVINEHRINTNNLRIKKNTKTTSDLKRKLEAQQRTIDFLMKEKKSQKEEISLLKKQKRLDQRAEIHFFHYNNFLNKGRIWGEGKWVNYTGNNISIRIGKHKLDLGLLKREKDEKEDKNYDLNIIKIPGTETSEWNYAFIKPSISAFTYEKGPFTLDVSINGTIGAEIYTTRVQPKEIKELEIPSGINFRFVYGIGVNTDLTIRASYFTKMKLLAPLKAGISLSTEYHDLEMFKSESNKESYFQGNFFIGIDLGNSK